MLLVENADAVIIIGGKIGTLNEFTIAFVKGKKIGILSGSGGVVELIPKIAAVCDKRGEGKNIFYSESANELIRKIV